MKHLKPYLIVLLLAFAMNGFSQPATTSTPTPDSTVHAAISLFNNGIGEQSRLYNGPEYNLHERTIVGNAYYPDNDSGDWHIGSVTYDGIYYEKVPLLYDVNLNTLVALLYNNYSRYSLLSNRVQDFTLQNHHFIRIDADSLPKNTVLTTGFYDELYRGDIQILAQRYKSIQTRSSTYTKLERYFNLENSYYLKKGNSYYAFNGKGTLLNILKDHKKDLQQYLKQSGLSYNSAPEDVMVKLAAYYDQLTTKK